MSTDGVDRRGGLHYDGSECCSAVLCSPAIDINPSPQMYGIYIMLLFLKLDKCKTCGFLDVDRRRGKPVVVGFIRHVGWRILCSFDGLRVFFGKYGRNTVSVLKEFIKLNNLVAVVFS